MTVLGNRRINVDTLLGNLLVRQKQWLEDRVLDKSSFLRLLRLTSFVLHISSYGTIWYFSNYCVQSCTLVPDSSGPAPWCMTHPVLHLVSDLSP